MTLMVFCIWIVSYWSPFTYVLHSSCTVLGNLEIPTVEKGRFLLHCHQTRPTIVLGNTQGPGRLKVVTASQGPEWGLYNLVLHSCWNSKFLFVYETVMSYINIARIWLIRNLLNYLNCMHRFGLLIRFTLSAMEIKTFNTYPYLREAFKSVKFVTLLGLEHFFQRYNAMEGLSCSWFWTLN